MFSRKPEPKDLEPAGVLLAVGPPPTPPNSRSLESYSQEIGELEGEKNRIDRKIKDLREEYNDAVREWRVYEVERQRWERDAGEFMYNSLTKGDDA